MLARKSIYKFKIYLTARLIKTINYSNKKKNLNNNF